jgi:hypothetical protein
MIWYNDILDEWRWYLCDSEGTKKLVRRMDAGFAYAERVDIGGETTEWNYDMGVSVFGDVRVYRITTQTPGGSWIGQWEQFAPSDADQEIGYYPPSSPNALWPAGRYITALLTWPVVDVYVFSDHHRTSQNDACHP